MSFGQDQKHSPACNALTPTPCVGDCPCWCHAAERTRANMDRHNIPVGTDHLTLLALGATPLTTRPKKRSEVGRTLTIRLPEEVLAQLDTEATARVLSRTKLAELLLTRGLAALPPLDGAL